MIFETEKIIIGGLTFEKVNEIRTLKSVFVLVAKDGSCMEVPVLDDENIDKEKLAKELLNYYRKEVVALIDMQNDINRPNSNYVKLWFVGVKKFI